MPINLVNMTNLEKCNAGIEYSYADEELIALKTEAIRQCEIFNALDGRDYMAQYRHLQQMLGAVGERVWIAMVGGVPAKVIKTLENDL